MLTCTLAPVTNALASSGSASRPSRRARAGRPPTLLSADPATAERRPPVNVARKPRVFVPTVARLAPRGSPREGTVTRGETTHSVLDADRRPQTAD